MLNEARLAEEPELHGRSSARVVTTQPAVALVGRILICALFLVSGIAKLTDPAGTAGYMTSVGIPYAHPLAIVAGCAEILGGLSVLLGLFTRVGAAGLFLFLIPTTLAFHNFWALDGDAAKMQMVNFLKNLSIMGGLAMLVAHGPGRFSIDAKRRHTLHA